MKVTTHSIEETNKVAGELLSQLTSPEIIGARGVSGATVVSLVGDLGAGKTTLTRAIAHALGITEDITSPTFVIEKIYSINGNFSWKRLVHIDTYRFESEDEIKALRFNELLNDKDTLIMIEWGERIASYLPTHTHVIRMKFIDENTREIQFDV